MRKKTVAKKLARLSKARREGRDGRRQASEGYVVFKLNRLELWPGEYWDGPHHSAASARRGRTRCMKEAKKGEKFIVVHMREIPSGRYTSSRGIR